MATTCLPCNCPSDTPSLCQGLSLPQHQTQDPPHSRCLIYILSPEVGEPPLADNIKISSHGD